MSDGKSEYTDKMILFKENPKRHADFKIRLEYEGITQSKFFRLMLRKMVEQDKRVLSLVDDWKQENNKITNRKQKMIEDDRKKREEFEEEYTMSDKEIRGLYDLFEDD